MYVQRFHKNWESREAEDYKPCWAKEKVGVLVWDFKGEEGNSHGDAEANVW